MTSTVAWIKEVKMAIEKEKEEKENEKKPDKEKAAPAPKKPSGPSEVETRFLENLRRLIHTVKTEQKKFTQFVRGDDTVI